MDNPNRSDEAEFERRWEELASQLSDEMTSPDASGPGKDAPEWRGSVVTGEPGVAGGQDDPLMIDLHGPGMATAGPSGAGPRDWAAPDEDLAWDDDDDHFVPAEPDPVLSSEPLLVLAWAALGIGLLGLAALVVFAIETHWMVSRVLVFLVAAGLGTLIWRMPHKRENPEDPGAKV